MILRVAVVSALALTMLGCSLGYNAKTHEWHAGLMQLTEGSDVQTRRLKVIGIVASKSGELIVGYAETEEVRVPAMDAGQNIAHVESVTQVAGQITSRSLVGPKQIGDKDGQ